MSTLSTHILDISTGTPAEGVTVSLSREGETLANLVDIAADAGFADQSHMTRQFISRFGLSPGRWLRAIRG